MDMNYLISNFSYNSNFSLRNLKSIKLLPSMIRSNVNTEYSVLCVVYGILPYRIETYDFILSNICIALTKFNRFKGICETSQG